MSELEEIKLMCSTLESLESRTEDQEKLLKKYSLIAQQIEIQEEAQKQILEIREKMKEL